MTRRFEYAQPMLFLGAALAALALGRYVATSLSIRVAITLIAVPLIVAIGFRAPRFLLFSLLTWLVVLGTFRRIVALGSGNAKADVLLLIGPVAVGILVLVAAQHGAFERMTALAKVVMALSVLVVLSTLNPLQGSALTGVAGLLFVLVPMLGFWVGRGLVDDRTMRRVFWAIAGFAVFNAIYGLAQVHVGFPRWDQHWLDTEAVTVIQIGGQVRSFGTFSAASEYARYLAIGAVILLWLTPGRRWVPVALPASLLLLVALVYESSRGVLVWLAATTGILFAARKRLSMPVAAIAGVVLVLGVFTMVRHVVPDPSSPLLAHQVEGLQDPLNPDSSTGPGHFSRIVKGIGSIADRPLGSGVGTVTLASKTFGGFARTTEADPSNISVALGLPGFVLWLGLVFLGLRLAYRTAVRRPYGVTLVALGVLTVVFLQWLRGAEYAVAILPWLVLGWLDRREVEGGEVEPAPSPSA
jgi:hypothetical protein